MAAKYWLGECIIACIFVGAMAAWFIDHGGAPVHHEPPKPAPAEHAHTIQGYEIPPCVVGSSCPRGNIVFGTGASSCALVTVNASRDVVTITTGCIRAWFPDATVYVRN